MKLQELIQEMLSHEADIREVASRGDKDAVSLLDQCAYFHQCSFVHPRAPLYCLNRATHWLFSYLPYGCYQAHCDEHGITGGHAAVMKPQDEDGELS